MNELPFVDRMLRVIHSHVLHRAAPPTILEPWTDNRKDAPGYRQYIGFKVINTETREVDYLYLVPDFVSSTPSVRIYYGPTGDPEHDDLITVVTVSRDA